MEFEPGYSPHFKLFWRVHSWSWNIGEWTLWKRILSKGWDFWFFPLVYSWILAFHSPFPLSPDYFTTFFVVYLWIEFSPQPKKIKSILSSLTPCLGKWMEPVLPIALQRWFQLLAPEPPEKQPLSQSAPSMLCHLSHTCISPHSYKVPTLGLCHVNKKLKS